MDVKHHVHVDGMCSALCRVAHSFEEQEQVAMTPAILSAQFPILVVHVFPSMTTQLVGAVAFDNTVLIQHDGKMTS